MLGICNGFQILCEAGLLPGVLRGNASLAFVCRDVPYASSARTRRSPPAALPASGWHPGQARRRLLVRRRGARPELEENGQILLRYEENPNGSLRDVAGVINREGNVMGLMPHPEHAVDPLLGSPDGALILESMLDAVRERAAVPA